MTLMVRAPGALNQSTMDQSGVWYDDGQNRLIVDLRSCAFVDVYALVTLLTVITLWVREGMAVRVRLPRSKSATTYIARMRFFGLLPAGVQFDRDPPDVTERPSMLVELAPLNVHEGEFAIEQICNFSHPQLPPQLADSFVEALAELGANVIQHSRAEVGFLAGQRFEKGFQGRQPPRLQLVVGDAGIGIPRSLAEGDVERADLPDEEAVSLALQEGVTSKPSTNSGVGLSTVRDYADAFGGILRLRSERGLVIRRRGVEIVRRVPWLPGTIVAVELASPGARA